MKNMIKLAAVAFVASFTLVACNNNNATEEAIDSNPIEQIAQDEQIAEPVACEATDTVKVAEEKPAPAKKQPTKKETTKKDETPKIETGTAIEPTTEQKTPAADLNKGNKKDGKIVRRTL